MTLAMALSLCIPILLEEVHTTGVTLGIDYLDLRIELAGCLGNGVEHNQHALVSSMIPKLSFTSILNYRNM